MVQDICLTDILAWFYPVLLVDIWMLGSIRIEPSNMTGALIRDTSSKTEELGGEIEKGEFVQEN